NNATHLSRSVSRLRNQIHLGWLCHQSQEDMMASEQQILTDHEAIRNWAAARMGVPAVVDSSAASGVQPLLMIVFDQIAYQDQDRAERPQNAGGRELVEWDEWFELFDQAQLALVVPPEQPGIRDSTHHLVRRDEA